MARPSTIVIVTDIPRTQSGKIMRALQRRQQQTRPEWSFVAEPVRDENPRLKSATCCISTRPDLIDGDKKWISATSGWICTVCSADEAARREPTIELPSRLAANPSVRVGFASWRLCAEFS